jgi:hypothetical protein
MAGEGAKLEGGRVFEWEGVIEIGVTPSGEDQVFEMNKGREGSRQKAKKQCIGERPTWLSMHMDEKVERRMINGDGSRQGLCEGRAVGSFCW